MYVHLLTDITFGNSNGKLVLPCAKAVMNTFYTPHSYSCFPLVRSAEPSGFLLPDHRQLYLHLLHRQTAHPDQPALTAQVLRRCQPHAQIHAAPARHPLQEAQDDTQRSGPAVFSAKELHSVMTTGLPVATPNRCRVPLDKMNVYYGNDLYFLW